MVRRDIKGGRPCLVLCPDERAAQVAAITASRQDQPSARFWPFDMLSSNQHIKLARLATIVMLGILLPSAVLPQSRKVTAEDARVYREAMLWFKKAEALIGTPRENSEEQADLFRKALQIKPDFLEAHYNLGLVYANQKKLKEAVEELEAVRKLDPKAEGLPVHFLLASAYRELGNTSAAISVLTDGLEKKPKDMQMLKALAHLQMNGPDDITAMPALEKVLQLDASDLSARIDLALLYQKTGRLDEAITHYREAIRLEPKNFASHYNLALIYWKQKKFVEALAELEASNQISPGKVEVMARIGDLYALQNQHAKAAEAYGNALEKSPERASLYAKLGFSLAQLNRPAEAVSALEKAVGFNPKNAEGFYLLGDLYSELKRYDESITAYRRSLELNPKQKEVHYNLGTLYAERQELDAALLHLKEATRLDSSYAPAWSNLAIVSEKSGLEDEAILAYEKVITLGTARPHNHFRLGLLYAKRNQADPAITHLGKAIEMEPDKYRQILRDELKKVHSILDSIRYTERFARLLTGPPPKQP